MPGKTKGVNLTRWLAAQLRELIFTGEWKPGHTVPSQKELGRTYNVSGVTARNAVGLLTEEGLIKRTQGKRPVVADREPIHGLALKPHPTHAGNSTVRLAEPLVSFNRGRGTGTAGRQWTHGTVALPGSVAMLLDLEPDASMVERTMLLTIDDEPILASTSYLPVEVTGDGDEWQDVEVGQLALTGHAVMAGDVKARSRMPTPEELETLGMDRGVPVLIVPYPYQVLVDEQTVAAGVIVTARSDRVFLEWGDDLPD